MKKTRLLTVFALFLTAAVLAGCVRPNANVAAPPAQSTQLQSAETASAAQEYDQAITLYTDFLGSNPSGGDAARAYLGRGAAYFGQGRYDLAEDDYKAAEKDASDPNVRAQAELGLANCLYAAEKYEAAEKMYDSLRRSNNGALPQDEVLYRLAMSIARQDGRWGEAEDYLKQVIGTYPNGDFARPAQDKLQIVSARYYTVQLGAYRNKAIADRLAKDVKAKGFPVDVVAVDIKGMPGYSVRSGRFFTWRAVTDHEAKLKAAGIKDTYRLP